MLHQVEPGRTLIGRLQRGDDLLQTLTQVCRDAQVRLGRIEALGAVEGARVAVYDQAKQIYTTLAFPQPLEILALVGNVSLRDGQPTLHAHVTLGNASGLAVGGHLVEGTRVFACEFLITELTGVELRRGHDAPTGLPLWPLEG